MGLRHPGASISSEYHTLNIVVYGKCQVGATGIVYGKLSGKSIL